MPRQPFIDRGVLEAALVGLEQQRNELDSRIAEIRGRLSTVAPRQNSTPAGPRKKRRLSAAARKRIADATRRRWAAYRKAKQAR